MNFFDQTTLHKLEQLALVADRVRVGMLKGDRRSRKRGTAIEFADYRDYTRGDDLRRLDWNVMARLERPFIKLLEEEEDLAVHLLIDSSDSMDWPRATPPDDSHKLRYALRLAAGLGHIALTTGDQLTVTCLSSSDDRRWGPFRGGRNSVHLFQFLDATRAAGITNLNQSLKNYALRGRRPGLLLLITDLLSPGGFKAGLRPLLARGYEVGIIQLLSPDETDPPASGDLKLVDVETGQETEVTLDAPTRDRYRARLREWQAETASYCAAHAVHYVPVTTALPWDKLILQTLRGRGMVK